VPALAITFDTSWLIDAPRACFAQFGRLREVGHAERRRAPLHLCGAAALHVAPHVIYGGKGHPLSTALTLPDSNIECATLSQQQSVVRRASSRMVR